MGRFLSLFCGGLGLPFWFLCVFFWLLHSYIFLFLFIITLFWLLAHRTFVHFIARTLFTLLFTGLGFLRLHGHSLTDITTGSSMISILLVLLVYFMSRLHNMLDVLILEENRLFLLFTVFLLSRAQLLFFF